MTRPPACRSAFVNAAIMTPQGPAPDAHVVVEGAIIAAVDSGEPRKADFDDIIDLGGGVLLPGFIDLQINGGGGLLFNDDPSTAVARGIAAAHLRFGATRIFPTLISDDLDKIAAAIAAADQAAEEGLPGVAGVHIEGPFLNVERRGVHDPAKLQRLTPAAIELLGSARRARVLVTLAPELAEPDDIRRLAARGVRICAGHTNATYDEMRRAFELGVSGVTHLFNAMPTMLSRAPGAIAAALESTAWCGIIVDGHHVHPAMLKLAWRAKADHRFMLVSDAMSVVGADIDHFDLGGRRIEVRDGACRAEDGTLAGSALGMIDAVGNAVSMMGVTLFEASRMASANPAAFAGLSDAAGSISPGLAADFVHVDHQLRFRNAWVGGVKADA